MDYQAQYQEYKALADAALNTYFADTTVSYHRLLEAMHYSLTAGGKRLRPVIVLEFCRLHGGDLKDALPFACALEMIHTYSLIHDDLPCMDNDDLRRGRPTCHKAFDEATAVLAGDGLLTAAFETASQADIPAETALRCIRVLGENAGMNGMIGGQVLDMGAEHRKISLDELRLLQKLKTGCLLRAACELGCAAAGATDEDTLARARAYGEKLGLAFQIRDDMLDVIGDAGELGKAVGMDTEKNTFVRLYGLEKCESLVHHYTEKAISFLSAFDDTEELIDLAERLTTRRK